MDEDIKKNAEKDAEKDASASAGKDASASAGNASAEKDASASAGNAEKDPFAEIRYLLYRQKPETREAEMRVQKNRAKATAFLQAFGTIADAFTLHGGGVVPKRDLNPYIMNNMQRADAMGEQDRADKKAWENSLLNLENNVAQYNARQIEIARQREWEEKQTEKAQEFQREMTGKEQGYRLGVMEQQRKIAEEMEKEKEAFKKWEMAQEFIYKLKLLSEQGKLEKELKSLTGDKSSGDKAKTYTIRDPFSGSAKPIEIPEYLATRILEYMTSDRELTKTVYVNGRPIQTPVYESKPGYTDAEIKTALARLEYENPSKMKEYISLILFSRLQEKKETREWNNPWQTPQSPYPQGQGPVAPEAPKRIKESINDYF